MQQSKSLQVASQESQPKIFEKSLVSLILLQGRNFDAFLIRSPLGIFLYYLLTWSAGGSLSYEGKNKKFKILLQLTRQDLGQIN